MKIIGRFDSNDTETKVKSLNRLCLNATLGFLQYLFYAYFNSSILGIWNFAKIVYLAS